MLYTSVIELSHCNLVSDSSYLLTNNMLAWFYFHLPTTSLALVGVELAEHGPVPALLMAATLNSYSSLSLRPLAVNFNSVRVFSVAFFQAAEPSERYSRM